MAGAPARSLGHVDSAIADVETLLQEYLEREQPDETPCLSNDLYYDGAGLQIVDSAVPIWTHESKTAWYQYESELEAAYENAGVGENPRDNNGMVAIYFYISDKVAEWYEENAEEIFESWYDDQQAENDD